MAKPLRHFRTHMTILVFLALISIIQEVQTFSTQMSPSTLNLKNEKLTHLRFYFHDILNSQNVTVLIVVPPNLTKYPFTRFGQVNIMDDPLTETPELTSSGVIGYAQGIYVGASKTEAALVMAFTFVFTKGVYKDSTLSVLGCNRIFTDVRELPILGGSGRFRFARGFALARTHAYDKKTLNAILEFSLYILHY